VVLLYYAVVRSVFGYIQDLTIQWRGKDFVVPYSNPNNIEKVNKPKSWKEFIGNVTARLAYNRSTFRGSLYLTIFWFIVSFISFNMAAFHKVKKWKMTEVLTSLFNSIAFLIDNLSNDLGLEISFDKFPVLHGRGGLCISRRMLAFQYIFHVCYRRGCLWHADIHFWDE